MSAARKTLIICISVLVLLVIGLIVADVVARSSAQNQARQALESISGIEVKQASVKAKGEPFITQALAGKLKDVRASAEEVQFNVEGSPVSLVNVTAQFKGLTTKLPYVVDSMSAEARITADSLQQLAIAKGLRMDLSTREGYIDLSTEVSGIPIVVSMSAEATTQNSSDLSRVVPAIKFVPANVSLNVEAVQSNILDQQKKAEEEAARLASEAAAAKESGNKKSNSKKSSSQNTSTTRNINDLSSLLSKFQLPSFVFPLDQAPEGLEISSIAITAEGVSIKLEGSNLNLSALSKAAAPVQLAQ